MAGYIFKIAETADEFEQLYRLRFDAFCIERKFYNKEKFPNGLLIDEFDPRSFQFIAKKDDLVVATARLTPFQKSSQICFPALRFANFPSRYFNEKSIEISGGVIRKEFRKKARAIFLLNYVYNYCKGRYDNILAIVNKDMFNIFLKTKIPFIYFGEPVNCEGYTSYPFIVSVKEKSSVL